MFEKKTAKIMIRKVSENEFMATSTDAPFLEFMKDIGDGYSVRRSSPPAAMFPAKTMPAVMRFIEEHHETKAEPLVTVDISQDHLKEIYAIFTHAKNRRDTLKRIKEMHASGTLGFDYEMKGQYAPFKHQIMMYNVCTQMDVVALFSDMGTGKTGPIIWSIDKRIQRNEIKAALIVTLKCLTKNVQKEIAVQAPHISSVVLRGGTLQTCKNILFKMFKIKSRNRDYDIYITNYEALSSLSDALKGRFDMVVFDESHRLANFTSRCTKVALKLFDYTKFKVISTGTPFSNKLWSFFMQFRILSADLLPIADFYAFMGSYFEQNQFNRFVYKPRMHTESKIKAIIDQVSVRFKRQDCLDLPPMSYKLFTCDITKEQMDDYEKLERDMLIGLDCLKCNKFSTATNVGESSPCLMCEKTLLLENILNLGAKLDQIVNGYMYGNVETENIIEYQRNPKIEVLFEIMESISPEDKIVIWCPYVPMLKRIEAELKKAGLKYIRAYGDDDVFDAQERFNADPDCRCMLANQRKAGTGLNFWTANYEIFVANDFSHVLRDQAEARLHRPPQKKNVLVCDIICPGTADEAIYDALHFKKNMSERLLENVRIRLAKRKTVTEGCEAGPEEDGRHGDNDNAGSPDDKENA